MSFLKVQNYPSQCSSCGIFRKMGEKLFWITEAVNEASETNSIMNLSHILYVIADTKAPCTILYISGNIPIKTSRTPAQTPPSPPFTKVILSWQKLQYPED